MKQNLTNIKFKIRQGNCNGYHSTIWYANNQELWQSSADTALPETLEFTIQMPCTIKIVVSGKNMNLDTVLVDDKIVADKFTQLSEVYLAGYPIKESVLFEICKYHGDDNKIYSSTYCHSNGVLELNINNQDPVKWHLLNNN